MSPAIEIAAMLAANLAGNDWPLSVSTEPDKPDETITLYDTGGLDTIEEDSELRQPTIQVRTRSREYPAGMAKQQAIYDLLAPQLERTIGAHRYIGIWLQGDISGIGRDDHDRHLITANYRVIRQPNGAT